MNPTDDPLARARELDTTDPLGRLVDAFHPPADGQAGPTIYLAGHALGPQPHATGAVVERELRRWRQDLISGWDDRWFELADALTGPISKIVGTSPASVQVGTSVTVAMHQLTGAAMALRSNRPDIVVSEGDPPTNLHALAQRAEAAGGTLRMIGAGPTPGMVTQALDESVGVVALAHVDFRSGSMLDLAGITEAAHRAGAWMLWDCSHSAGVAPIGLDEHGVDLAVGSLSKHLFGGPGAPAWMSVREDLLARLDPPLHGWFGHADRLSLDPQWRPSDGVGRFLPDVPSVLSMAGSVSGVQLVASVDRGEVREKSESLNQLAVALCDAWLAPHGLQLVTPRRSERRAAHLTLRHPDAAAIVGLMNERWGVQADHRPPDLLRLGLSPLPLRFIDLVVALRRVRDGLNTGAHLGRGR